VSVLPGEIGPAPQATFIKICGLRTERAVAAAVAAGADAVGFVFAESPRQVTPARAMALCRDLSPIVMKVAVMRHPAPAEWQAVWDRFDPDWLQTDAGDFAALTLPEPVTPIPVYRDVADLDEDAAAAPDLILFEAAASGRGERADWDRAARLAARTRLILAGGLTPENVGEAIRRVRPFGVDVSSGVESRPGVKDPARIEDFIAAVREAERVNAG
jgi:phosphoribosylanthranilate isomerase